MTLARRPRTGGPLPNPMKMTRRQKGYDGDEMMPLWSRYGHRCGVQAPTFCDTIITARVSFAKGANRMAFRAMQKRFVLLHFLGLWRDVVALFFYFARANLPPNPK
jgi:hypothetical protein